MTKSVPMTLALGIDKTVIDFLNKEIKECNLMTSIYGQDSLEVAISPAPTLILCGQPNAGTETVEVAQSLRMIYPKIPIFFVSVDRTTFNRKQFQKNGFNDAFLLPSDQAIFSENVKKIIAAFGELKVYKNVKLIDIPSDSVLGFDLYLHLQANDKYVKYASATDSLDEKRSQRLRKNNVMLASVSEDQMSDFYKFTANQLKKIGSSARSETEKKELREDAIRNLFTGIFGEVEKGDTISHGREVINDCQEIIKMYILSENESSSQIYNKMLSISNGVDGAYAHSSNVSTYATLFCIGLGIGKPDEVALAGLLHDIGLADIPNEISSKPEAERTVEEEAVYKKHPKISVNMLKEKRLIISERLMKIIEQHHERYDGTGYPNAVIGTRILPEAQLIAIADHFDYLTKSKPGSPRVLPEQAMAEILRLNSSKPGHCAYDPVLLQQIIDLLNSAAKAV